MNTDQLPTKESNQDRIFALLVFIACLLFSFQEEISHLVQVVASVD